MTDISKILTAVLSGGTQSGGQGGLLGQLAGGAQSGQGGGIGAILNSLGGGQSGQGGSLIDQVKAAIAQAQGSRGGPSSVPSVQTGAAPIAPGQGGGFLEQITNALQSGSAQGGLGGLLGQAADVLRNQSGGFAGGAAAGTLAGLLLGTGAGRRIAGSAATLGGLAAISGLAYVALRNYTAGRPVVQGTINDVTSLFNGGQQPPAGFTQAAGSADATAEVLVRSMVAAAFADGVLSDDERHAIVGQLDGLGLGADERAYLDGLLNHPDDVSSIAALCQTDELKAQAYLAAHLAIHVDTAAEAQFLGNLAQALGLDSQLVAHLDQAAAEAKASAAA
ncbi:tellurite resistance TerB family protein [Phreatobacter aquaticus]|uniref:Tellurite resistance TerB family protein n=1 Tax=Phreatobacter aquaticus TaxID=2570229 RepID=A0A4D7QGX3_9HYPH|nr:tellurite resistance TerB family protein [Phreatobacter aquaticus]QCK84696.1 tellurite resistance TerB family protein [Phreatobacter aquaticus]